MWYPFKKQPATQKQPEKSFTAVVDSLFGDWFTTYSRSRPLSLVPVYACIKIISQTVAIADMKMYRRGDKGREELPNHKLVKLFRSPFMEMTYFNWQQMMMMQLAGYGNAYALIVRDMSFSVKELVPLENNMVGIIKDPASSTYYYQVTHNGKTFSVFPENMLHYKLFSEDGIRGLSPVELHKGTVDSLHAERDYLESFYDKAANLSGVVESEAPTQRQVDSIKQAFESKYGGSANAGKTVILPGGMKYKQLKLLSPMDANYIETAKLNRADIGVIFGVPLSLLGDLSQATYSNLSELNRAFYKMTIAPYFKAIASENNMKLLNEADKSKIYFEFDPEILLSANKKDRYEAYAIAIRNGILTRNEVREVENLKTLDGLDEILQESGVLTKEQADKQFKESEDGNDNTNSSNDGSNTIDETTNQTNEKNTSLREKVEALRASVKDSNIENQSDVLSHLGRVAGLVKTSVETSKKDMV